MGNDIFTHKYLSNDVNFIAQIPFMWFITNLNKSVKLSVALLRRRIVSASTKAMLALKVGLNRCRY